MTTVPIAAVPVTTLLPVTALARELLVSLSEDLPDRDMALYSGRAVPPRDASF